MVCLALHEKWVVDADAIWLVAGLVVLLASVSGKCSRVSGRLVRHQVRRLRSRQRGPVGVTVVRISVSLLDSSGGTWSRFWLEELAEPQDARGTQTGSGS